MLIVTSNIKTIQNAVCVLNKLEANKCQHHNPQQWSIIRTSHMHVPVTVLKATEMKKPRGGRTYVSREQRRTRNFMYPEQECYDIQETYRNVTTYKRHTGMLRHTRDIQEVGM